MAHELAHVLQQRTGQAMIRRQFLYPDPTVTADDDPISRYLRGDDKDDESSLALTTLTLNGIPAHTSDALKQALRNALIPKRYEHRDAPAKPGRLPQSDAGSGSGFESGAGAGSASGSGSGAATEYCGFADFDVSVSAIIRLPKQPVRGQWGPEPVKRQAITRPGVLKYCPQVKQISVVMRGDPNSNSFYKWLTSNEDEHVKDMKEAAMRFLEPLQQAMLAMRGAGANVDACVKDVQQQFDRMDQKNLTAFEKQLWVDKGKRDIKGRGHKFDTTITNSNNCNDLELRMKGKTPPPKGGGP